MRIHRQVASRPPAGLRAVAGALGAFVLALSLSLHPVRALADEAPPAAAPAAAAPAAAAPAAPADASAAPAGAATAAAAAPAAPTEPTIMKFSDINSRDTAWIDRR